MNPHIGHSASLKGMFLSFWQHRNLISQMTMRDVLGRYRGSVIGLAWSFFNPVLMLIVYTFVFSVVFKARWGVGENETNAQFAVVLFVGLIVHGIFCEVLNRAPNLILSNINYVKKVVFPLEILPLVSMGTAIFHGLISLCVLMIAFVISNGFIHWTIIYFPLVLLPLLILCLGLAWILASLGVFLRDIGQAIGIITSVMMFMAPVFYPISILPEVYHPYILANPITFIIEQARAVVIWGEAPDWAGLGVYLLISISVLFIGFFWFQKTRKGFADVL